MMGFEWSTKIQESYVSTTVHSPVKDVHAILP